MIKKGKIYSKHTTFNIKKKLTQQYPCGKYEKNKHFNKTKKRTKEKVQHRLKSSGETFPQ
jgi:hypothetical protein